MPSIRLTKSIITGLAAGSLFAITHPVDGFGGGCSGGSTIEIHVETPGHNSPSAAKHADILLQYVTWPDGTSIDEFIYVDDVRDVEYEGPIRKMRAITGPDSEVGNPGVFDIEDGDGNSGSVSSQDLSLFADRILNAWNHNNLNGYIDLRSNAHYSFTVDFEATIRDNSPLEDDVGELLIFEVAGNSIVQIEALDEQGQTIGTPVIVGYGSEWKRVAPERLYVGRYANNGSPRCGSFEYKATGVDLTDLGVMELNTLRISRPTNAGCSDVRADTRIVGVKTSIVPTAAMVFD
ncbi:MAG: hypothetical protein MK095_09045 [Phycisphaerales bacterium]|nr:hypothetical protein [Phycisphaerales bacterium]